MRPLVVIVTALGAGGLGSVGCRKAPPPTPATDAELVASATSSAAPSLSCAAACRLQVLAPMRKTEWYQLRVDGPHIYLAGAWASSVARIPTAGGQKTVLLPGRENKFGSGPALAVGATEIYWVTDNRLFRAPKDGGAPIEILPSDGRPVRDLTLQAGELWWVTMTDPSTNFKRLETQVYRLVDGRAVAVGKAEPDFALRHLFAKGLLFLDGTRALVDLSPETGKRSILARGFGENADLVGADDNNVYLVEPGELVRVPRGTPGPRAVVARVPADAQAFLLDGDVFWVATPSTLLRVPLGGGAPTVHEDWSPNRFGHTRPVADAGAVYLDLRTGTSKFSDRFLVRIPK